jgi:adenine-specific DNA-methyltransferase
MQGNNYQVDKEPLLALPILNSDDQSVDKIKKLVDKIISMMQSADYSKNISKQANVKEYEREIDQMVYKLYGLTKEEVEIIEKSLTA